MTMLCCEEAARRPLQSVFRSLSSADRFNPNRWPGAGYV